MLFAEEMQELAEGIVASKRSRIEGIANLKNETQNQLAGYKSDRQAMAQELHAGLEADKAALMADTATLMKELGELDAARQAEVRVELAEARSQLKSDTAALMKGLGRGTKARRKEVKAELAEARSQLKSEIGALMRELKAEMKAARRAWQQGLRAALRESKPRPPARRTSPRKAASPKEPAA